jgi:wobble nucleotide-excising tRNase
MDFELELKTHFNTLMKAGSKEVYKIIDELESYISDTSTLTIVERRMENIITTVRKEKRLSFTHFKELYPFLLSERKLAEARKDRDEYIILD